MVSALKKITYFLLAALIMVTLYSGYVILQARDQTPAIFATALTVENAPLNLDQFGKKRLDMMLKIQDPGFFDHHGVDFKTPGQGMTSLTQAIVKFLYFKKFKAGPAKLKQSLIAAFAVTPLISKQDQLRVFINQCYLGHNNKKAVRGFAQAAQIYLGKEFSALSKEEFLGLVAMLIAPNGYHIKRFPQKNAKRVERIKAVLSGDYTPKSLNDLYYNL